MSYLLSLDSLRPVPNCILLRADLETLPHKLLCSNSRQTTSHVARDGASAIGWQARQKNEGCTTAAAIAKHRPKKSVRDVL